MNRGVIDAWRGPPHSVIGALSQVLRNCGRRLAEAAKEGEAAMKEASDEPAQNTQVPLPSPSSAYPPPPFFQPPLSPPFLYPWISTPWISQRGSEDETSSHIAQGL